MNEDEGKIEIAWMIERDGDECQCLGVDGFNDFYWTDPYGAIRFAREKDADATAKALLLTDYFVAEHEWS